MMKTRLKPLEFDYAVEDAINEAMRGSAGTAAVKFSRNVEGIDRAKLARDLVEIELKAREKMKDIILKHANK